MSPAAESHSERAGLDGGWDWRAVATGAALVAVALVEGGYGDQARSALGLFVWLLVAALVYRRRSIEPSPTLLTAFAGLAGLALWSYLSLAWGSNDGEGFLDGVTAGTYAGVVAGVALLDWPVGTWMRGLAAGLGAIAVLALGPRLLGVDVGDDQLAATLPAADGRISFPIGYWNALGLCGALVIPLAIWLAGSRGGERLAGYALLGPAIGVMVLSETRSAMLATGLAAGLYVWLSADRRRSAATVLAALTAALPLVVLLGASDSLQAGDSGGPPPAGLAAAALIAALPAFAMRVERKLRGPIASLVIPSIEGRARLAVVVVSVLAALVALGPGGLIGDFSAGDRSGERDLSRAVSSGSGRAEFWDAALAAFGEAPIRGIGAGNYGNWWNANGELDVSVENAHSVWLETLAELGAVGLTLLLIAVAAVAAAARRALRDLGTGRPGTGSTAGRDRDLAAAGIGLLVVGVVGASLDWVWEIPATMLPIVVVAALFAAGSFGSGFRLQRSLEASSELAGYVPRRSPAWLGPTAAATILISLALAAVAASGLKLVSSERLDASRDALSIGDVVGAAEAARGAAAIEPWASEPELTLAAIEQGAGNLDAAARAAARAARSDPEDFRPWLLLAQIHAALGEQGPAASYFRRAQSVAPLVLGRAFIADR